MMSAIAVALASTAAVRVVVVHWCALAASLTSPGADDHAFAIEGSNDGRWDRDLRTGDTDYTPLRRAVEAHLAAHAPEIRVEHRIRPGDGALRRRRPAAPAGRAAHRHRRSADHGARRPRLEPQARERPGRHHPALRTPGAAQRGRPRPVAPAASVAPGGSRARGGAAGGVRQVLRAVLRARESRSARGAGAEFAGRHARARTVEVVPDGAGSRESDRLYRAGVGLSSMRERGEMLAGGWGLAPDVGVADISMPRLNGLEALARLEADDPDVKVVFLTMHTEAAFARRALQAGAAGFVVKHAAVDELVLAVRAALAGETFVTPGLAGVLRKGNGAASAGPACLSPTARQREILELMAKGPSAKEIADMLTISTRTVEFHKYRMREAWGLHNGAELVHFTIKVGVVPT